MGAPLTSPYRDQTRGRARGNLADLLVPRAPDPASAAFDAHSMARSGSSGADRLNSDRDRRKGPQRLLSARARAGSLRVALVLYRGTRPQRDAKRSLSESSKDTDASEARSRILKTSWSSPIPWDARTSVVCYRRHLAPGQERTAARRGQGIAGWRVSDAAFQGQDGRRRAQGRPSRGRSSTRCRRGPSVGLVCAQWLEGRQKA